jgi:hypothetical protein
MTIKPVNNNLLETRKKKQEQTSPAQQINRAAPVPEAPSESSPFGNIRDSFVPSEELKRLLEQQQSASTKTTPND